MNINEKPTCYIVAGPNGAGKTTFALRYLPEIVNCRNFVNADMIAYGLSPLDLTSVQFDAGKIFLSEVNKNIARRVDFALETTLAGRSYIKLIRQLKKDGWQVVMFFLWIPDADFSRNRVIQRVTEGGHDIPVETIYRRYPRIMFNFWNVYSVLCDRVFCYDNTDSIPVPVFEQTGTVVDVKNVIIYNKMRL
ncbi:MAG: zeta toxin family protein [Sedimentisphaerales bacterium]|nr:zeta toxin family protein [Sedimentisphaerales bacterium]